MKKIFALLFIFSLMFTLAACAGEAIEGPQGQQGIQGIQGPQGPQGPQGDSLSLQVPRDAANAFVFNTTQAVANISLPTTFTFQSKSVSLVWQSSHPEVINTNGVVNQPSYSTGEVNVSLTALFIFEGAVASKTFMVKVPALPESNVERVAGAIQAIGLLLEEDIQNESIDLPTLANGANIEWLTSNPGYFSVQGEVIRPHFDQTNQEVVLTAYISAGAQFQIYRRVVTVEKMPFKQYGLLATGPFNSNIINSNEAAPLTFKLVTKDNHEIHIPYSNVNAEFLQVGSPYPQVYLPTFGDKVPLVKNAAGTVVASGFGVAHVIVNGVVETIYDGIGGRIYNNDYEGGFIPLTPAGVTPAVNYLSNIPIPDDGFVVVFLNTGGGIGNTLNGREFGRSILGVSVAALGQTLTMEGLELDSVGVSLRGGIWWRGFVDVTVPFRFINPAPFVMFNTDPVTQAKTSNLAFFQSLSMTSDNLVPAADGSNVTGAYPLLFNAAYLDTYGVTVIDTGQGFTIAAEIRPELESLQVIQVGGNDVNAVLTNDYEVFRVYDGIGASIKIKGAAQSALAGADSGKAMQLNRDGFIAFWANNGVSYAQDSHNRRIAADYFYAIDNWIWFTGPVSTSEMLVNGYIKIDAADVFEDIEIVPIPTT
jgi:hypothetical protein